jgi:hypothetical protein
MADALHTVHGPEADVDKLREVDQAAHRLADAIREQRHQAGDDKFTAGSVVTAVRRAIASLAPEDVSEELPSYS